MKCERCGEFVLGPDKLCPSCKKAEQPTISSPSNWMQVDWKRLVMDRKRLVMIVCGVIAAIVLIAVLLGSANSSPNVPDQLIRDDISKKFGTVTLGYSATHNMDETTHIDTVTIKTVREGKYIKEHYIGTLQYRYNKSDDTWDSYGNPKWEVERVEYLAHKYTKKWEGDFNIGGTFTANITAVDFDKGTITGSFSASKTSLSLGGSRHTYTLDATGTYTIKEESDGYELEIMQSGYTFVFLLDRYYGFRGITIYNARTGYAV